MTGARQPAPFPRHVARPIFGRWRNPRKIRRAIRRSIRRRTRRSRRAPRRARAGFVADRPALADLLNPGIGKGTAGVGAQTGLEQKPETSGLKPPPDNSFDRRADFSAAHRARKSTKGFDEAPQSGYVGKTPNEPVTINTKLAEALGYRMPGDEDDDDDSRAPSGVTATAQALEKLLREGRRNSPTAAAPPSGRRTGRRGRRNPKAAAARHQVRLRAQGRPAAGDRGAGRGREAPRPHAGAARRHRLRQDLHHGEGDRGDAAPGADPRAQQDAGGAALRRVQELLPRQRGRVFRHLLRLLPAGSLRPAHRHLYREGIPRSTSRSTACAIRRRARCSSATT